MGPYRSLTRWIGDKPWFRPIARELVPRVDTVLLRSTGLRVTPFETLLLTTIGRSSGKPRQRPLWYVEDDGGFVVVASNYGRSEPDWSQNLAANPMCTVKVGRRGMAARARPVADETWDRYFDRFVDFYPTYRVYVARAGRDVPIWFLEPAGSTATGS